MNEIIEDNFLKLKIEYLKCKDKYEASYNKQKHLEEEIQEILLQIKDLM